MLKRLLPSLFLLVVASSCVTVPNTKVCAVSGTIVAGAICAETLTGNKSEMTFEEFIEFLEPKTADGLTPERGGALCQSADDWNAQKTALEQACRLLGSRCTYAIKKTISNMEKATNVR